MSQADDLARLQQGIALAKQSGDMDKVRQLGVAYRAAQQKKAESDKRKEEVMSGMVDYGDPTERFDAARPEYIDGIVGEDAGRSFDAAVMGWGEQADGLIRGARNAWANLTGNEEAQDEYDLEAAQAKEFRDQTYGTSNPTATAVGEFATTAPTMLLPGGIGAQMAYGAAEGGLDHEGEFIRDDDGNITGIDTNDGLVNAGISGATTGIFGKAFDFMGRAFKNVGDDVAEVVGKGRPRVPGQSAEETRRLIKFADDNNVNMSPAQRSQKRAQLQREARMASQPSGAAINEIRDQQSAKLNQMVLDRYGIKGDAFTPDVLGAMDDVINKGYDEVGEALTRTVGDDQFLTNAAELATDSALTAAQKSNLDDFAMQVSEGMDGTQLINLRKKLQKQVKNNRATNGDYADALSGMVDEIDGLINRVQPSEVGLKFKDVRDQARLRMALEKGAAIGKDGNINPRSLDTALGSIYKGEFKRGRGAANDATQRVFDTVRLGNMLDDGIPNSGTATRLDKGLLYAGVDKFIREPTVGAYLAMPSLFNMFEDTLGDGAKAVTSRAGRAVNDDYEELKEKVDNILGVK